MASFACHGLVHGNRLNFLSEISIIYFPFTHFLLFIYFVKMSLVISSHRYCGDWGCPVRHQFRGMHFGWTFIGCVSGSTPHGLKHIGILWHGPTARYFATDGEVVSIRPSSYGVSTVDVHYNDTLIGTYYLVSSTPGCTRSAMYAELKEAAQRMHDKIEAKRCFNVFEEELIQKTWHPIRVMDWCMETIET